MPEVDVIKSGKKFRMDSDSAHEVFFITIVRFLLAVGRTGGLNVGLVGLGGFMKMLLPGGGLCVPNIEKIGGLKVCMTVAGGAAGVTD